MTKKELGEKETAEKGILAVEQPPYLQDLGQSAFWLLDTLKMGLRGTHLATATHQIEYDSRTPEDSERKILALLSAVAISLEQVCVRTVGGD
jgi:hypothetical protein